MPKQLISGENLDTIDMKAAQLDALLNSMYGGGFEAFMTLNPGHKECLIHLAADLVTDIRRALAAEVSRG